MKIKIFPAIIALALSALFAYGLYAWGNNIENKTLISIIGGVSLFLTIGTVLGTAFENKRKSLNLKTLSAIFSVVIIIADVVFSTKPNYTTDLIVIVSSFIILLWALLFYFVSSTKIK